MYEVVKIKQVLVVKVKQILLVMYEVFEIK